MNPVGAASPDLTGLYSIFGGDLASIPRARFVSAEETPEPYRRLLAHDEHMTVTMEAFHGAPAELEILDTAREGNWYARKILLRNSRTGRVVQFGLMRFNFDWCSAEVKEKIIEGKTPLGRILIEHNVLRSISTHALMKIEPNEEMRRVFGMPEAGSRIGADAVYGRLATIFCNGEPAVDLLEVAAPED